MPNNLTLKGRNKTWERLKQKDLLTFNEFNPSLVFNSYLSLSFLNLNTVLSEVQPSYRDCSWLNICLDT